MHCESSGWPLRATCTAAMDCFRRIEKLDLTLGYKVCLIFIFGERSYECNVLQQEPPPPSFVPQPGLSI
ncbi:unnamed protein product [Prunus armeniaca]|nr:unnamed protein product [Prunus armeniaca]